MTRRFRRGALTIGFTLVTGCDHERHDVPSTTIEATAHGAAIEPVPGFVASPPPHASAMVHIARGTFTMRDSERRAGVDIVVHAPTKTTVAPFELDATEVTAAAYMACVEAHTCPPPRPQDREDPLCTGLRRGYEQHPMTCVDWSQATAYCTAQKKRLPTEVEWEYAARGGQADADFPWGDAQPDRQLCWWTTQRGDESCRVASFPREALGTYDLGGNVAEWTATAEEPTHDERVAASTVHEGEYRVVRGGSFGTNASHGILGHSTQWTKLHQGSTGFRCAR